MSSNSVPRGTAIALAGAGGSHPTTLALVRRAIHMIDPARRVVILDLSAFDTRGPADYRSIDAPVVRITPGDVGMAQRFRTAAPNIVLSGGNRCVRALERAYADVLRVHDVGALLLSHSWGIPEQALMRSASHASVMIAQIDEGPFSIPLRGNLPETTNTLERVAYGALRRLGLLPRRDLSGTLIDRVISTAPGRAGRLIERGVDPDKILVVPHPRFDTLPGLAKRWRERSVQRPQRILWLHQPFRIDGKVERSEVDRAEAALGNALRRVLRDRQASVALRVHPRTPAEEVDRIHRLVASFAPDVDLSREASLHEALEVSDLIVGFYSSGLLEAAACGIPTVSVTLESSSFEQRTEAAKAAAMGELGIATGTTSQGLAQLIQAGLRQRFAEVPPELLDREIGTGLGNGAEQIAKMLVTMADRTIAGSAIDRPRTPLVVQSRTADAAAHKDL